MKILIRSLLLILLLGFATPVFAQALSAVQVMPLTTSQQFLNRVTFQIVLEAPLVEVEASAYTPAAGDTHPSTEACHTLRANLAASIARNPSGYALIFALHLVTTSNVTTAGALTGTLALGTLDTPATDAALFSAVSAIWSDTAGCITNP
jgi:hypothetical protein